MNKLYKVIALITFMTLVSGQANAYQVKAAKDDETLHFTIATKEYSRIFVTGDRISSVKGQQSLYEIKEFKGESDEGVLFIRPNAYLPTKPFSVFITTESGHHYTLKLQAVSHEPENIEIQPLSPVKTRALKWEQNTPYTQTLIALLRAMANNTQPDGYAVVSFDKVEKRQQKLKNGLSLTLLKVYRGHLLRGEVWLIKNETQHAAILLAKDFYQKRVRASSLVRETLESGQQTFLYRVVNDE